MSSDPRAGDGSHVLQMGDLRPREHDDTFKTICNWFSCDSTGWNQLHLIPFHGPRSQGGAGGWEFLGGSFVIWSGQCSMG